MYACFHFYQKSDLFSQYNVAYELHFVYPNLYLKLRFEPQIATVQIGVVIPKSAHGQGLATIYQVKNRFVRISNILPYLAI